MDSTDSLLMNLPKVLAIEAAPYQPSRTDPVTTDPANRWSYSQDRLHGPRFVSNREGLVLENSPNTGGGRSVVSSKFSGERVQQWLFQRDSVTGHVALASLHDGSYLALGPTRTIVLADSPYHWSLERAGAENYHICSPGTNLSLTAPTPPGACSVNAGHQVLGAEAQTRFIILKDRSGNRQALKEGSIGRFAYPGEPVYYTYASASIIAVHNHLSTKLYGAVSGPGNNAQWSINPGAEERWVRLGDQRIHISTPISDTGEQSAQVYECRSGMKLHIQNLEKQVKWHGISFVPVDEAEYTANPGKLNSIGVRNDLDFDIFVSVFSTIQNKGADQYKIKPNATKFWSRCSPESVFVGVGSAPGSPQAYLGRPGFILHIKDWRPSEAD
ncbi:hypothetical protein FA13DRAFT_1732003 [Coprinellus micaceus]|uniref:Uncharacterized protein n=1 Tax=Coprinellus micaceus TaxID=71717 RepID=A0A4Y7TE84_COPMI|nr:hypothetical protein FA13DRAFT_1732003 [Coprinellus micaceus]